MDIGDIFRKATRPIISIIDMAIIAQVVTQEIPVSPAVWTFLVGIPLWWFGSRQVEKLKTNGKSINIAEFFNLLTPDEVKRFAEVMQELLKEDKEKK